MSDIKCLVTSGCSFSEPYIRKTWPLWLEEKINSDNLFKLHYGLPSQGNNLIARKVIYGIHTALKEFKPDEILVGIVWSGPDRHDSYFSNIMPGPNTDGWLINPTRFLSRPDEEVNDPGAWHIMNLHWEEPKSKIYYTYLHDSVNGIINTYEKLLWVQHYCKLMGVKYFMTTYMDEVLGDNDMKENSNISWMRSQIDFENFLPVTSLLGWCLNTFGDNAFTKFITPTMKDYHPLEYMHEQFVDSVILPFIKTRYDI